MTTLIIISILIFLTSFFIIKNLIKKVEKYEESIEVYEKEISQRDEYLSNIINLMNFSKNKLKEIDEKGSFESDDEVGFFFTNLKEIQKYIDAYSNAFEEFKK